jgi:hypothetical protein
VEDVMPKLLERRQKLDAEAAAAEEYDDPYAALEELAASGVLV